MENNVYLALEALHLQTFIISICVVCPGRACCKFAVEIGGHGLFQALMPVSIHLQLTLSSNDIIKRLFD